ncbi:Gfo/Idh/MocA family oxidoreductase [Ramlibacter terrae]|uniref:Gfo/Idh/MocA family oxidoreductase n=1 Tax=Ramlibacter terrae TaxID=2732511 RepID=A0ABX6P2F2_9BURK|nr:Gfo/Idh/MocA family oxidoreductase [Ramlibacter terrae]
MSLLTTFGRPLRLAVIGGGPGSWIGNMHRGAAEMDGWFRVTAGVLSSDAQRSRAAGIAMGPDAARCYGSVPEMLAGESARADGVDAVAVMTPNDTHYPIAAAALDARLDVVCDKPVAHDFAQARDLVQRARANQRLFAVAHGYSAYPMTRYARQLVRNGAIGPVRLVQVEYIQSGLATRVEDGPLNNRLRWLFDPARSGQALVMSAIGCHAQHLATFVAGANVHRVMADVGTLRPGRTVVDHVSALLEFDGGARGTFTVTQAAAGGENDIRLRVYGEAGMIDWSHRDASYLKLAMQGQPVRTIGRGDPDLPAEIIALGRTPRGHPEGLREAFANIYAEVAQERMALKLGEPVPPFPIRAPRTARTPWRSSKPASRRRSAAHGPTCSAEDHTMPLLHPRSPAPPC